MKIEQYHHDYVDVGTYDLLSSMTGAKGSIDDRLVRIYCTYKTSRDRWNHSEPVNSAEWRFLCYELGLYVNSEALDRDLEMYLSRLTADEVLDEELRKRAVREYLLYAATRKASSSMLRAMEYHAAVLGLIPVPDFALNQLAERKRRYDDLVASRKQREESLAKERAEIAGESKPKPKASVATVEESTNGRLPASQVPDEKIGVPVTISHYGTRKGRFVGRDGKKIIFKEDGGSQFKLVNVRLLE